VFIHINPAAFRARTYSRANSRLLPCGHCLRTGKCHRQIWTPL